MFGFFVVHLWTELKYESVTLRNGQALSLPGGGDSDRVGKLGLVTVFTCSNLDR